MSLLGALNVGRSALAVNQTALQVTGNNIANAGNADYTREIANPVEAPSQQVSTGLFVGTGVDLSSVQRQVDQALQARLNSSVSDNVGANSTQQWTGQVESVFNALGSNSLDTQLTSFLGNWSDLANAPTDMSKRQVLVTQGQTLANQFNSLGAQLGAIQTQIGQQVTNLASTANQVAQQIASLNVQIANSAGGGTATNNSLLDQRDAAVGQLSNLLNVQTINQPNGTVNVYVGSEPLVLGGNNRGLKALPTSANGQPSYQLLFASDNANVPTATGQLGADITSQQQIGSVLRQLNSLASGVIFGLNSIHSSGQGLEGFSSVTGTNQVLDSTAALNAAAAGLTFPPVNGSFVISVKNTQTGLSNSTLVPVSLTGQPTDTSLNSLVTSLNAISGVQASVQGGKLSINATSPDQQITFSQDSSHVLAALGVNTFFQGTTALNMAVNSTVVSDPSLVAAAQNGDPGDATNALAIANLYQTPQTTVGGLTIQSTYQTLIGNVTNAVSQASSEAQSTQDIRTTLQSQRDAISGVSIDEETVNMLQQQRAYQGAARLISTVDQMMQTLLAIT